MTHPHTLFHFGQSLYLSDLVPTGHLSFGLAAGFTRTGLTKGQQDDEMKRTAAPPVSRTTLLVGKEIDDAQPISNLISVKVGLGIGTPYFMKCFSLGYSDDMYAEVDGDLCVEILDVPVFFVRFEKALETQLPGWGAQSAPARYWDFTQIPVGMSKGDLMFLKDSAQYSCHKEYRVILLPPDGFVVTGTNMRQSLFLGALGDIAKARTKA